MQSILLITLALFSASSFAADVSIDPAVVTQVIDRLEDFGTSILNNPTLASEVGATPSEIAKIKADLPEIKADLESYAGSLIKSPQFTSVADILATIVPVAVQSQIEANPGGFIVSLITASSLPPYISAVPTGVQSYLVSVAEHIASDVEDDINGPEPTTAPGSHTSAPYPFPTGTNPAANPHPTGTGFVTGGKGSPTSPPGSSPSPYTGAAAPSLRDAAASVALVLAGVAALVVL